MGDFIFAFFTANFYATPTQVCRFSGGYFFLKSNLPREQLVYLRRSIIKLIINISLSFLVGTYDQTGATVLFSCWLFATAAPD